MTEREMIIDFMRGKAAYVDCSLGRKVQADVIDTLADEIEQGAHLPENRDLHFPKRLEDDRPPQ